ncbi:hypothetical protein MXB_4049 [Myxobolus squamalis]|nr:hypothetical protein MXB_4049 [Myxobolus squamalis]
MSVCVLPALHAQSGFLEFITWPASFAMPAYIETNTPLATCLDVDHALYSALLSRNPK